MPQPRQGGVPPSFCNGKVTTAGGRAEDKTGWLCWGLPALAGHPGSITMRISNINPPLPFQLSSWDPAGGEGGMLFQRKFVLISTCSPQALYLSHTRVEASGNNVQISETQRGGVNDSWKHSPGYGVVAISGKYHHRSDLFTLSTTFY